MLPVWFSVLESCGPKTCSEGLPIRHPLFTGVAGQSPDQSFTLIFSIKSQARPSAPSTIHLSPVSGKFGPHLLCSGLSQRNLHEKLRGKQCISVASNWLVSGRPFPSCPFSLQPPVPREGALASGQARARNPSLLGVLHSDTG